MTWSKCLIQRNYDLFHHRFEKISFIRNISGVRICVMPPSLSALRGIKSSFAVSVIREPNVGRAFSRPRWSRLIFRGTIWLLDRDPFIWLWQISSAACGPTVLRLVSQFMAAATGVRRSPRAEHPLWLCNYLFQVLNDLANNLLLLPHSAGLFRLFSGLVITLKVPCIKQDECCGGLFISRNKFVTQDIKVCLREQFATP